MSHSEIVIVCKFNVWITVVLVFPSNLRQNIKFLLIVSIIWINKHILIIWSNMIKLVNLDVLVLTLVQKHVFLLNQEMNILMFQKWIMSISLHLRFVISIVCLQRTLRILIDIKRKMMSVVRIKRNNGWMLSFWIKIPARVLNQSIKLWIQSCSYLFQKFSWLDKFTFSFFHVNWSEHRDSSVIHLSFLINLVGLTNDK